MPIVITTAAEQFCDATDADGRMVVIEENIAGLPGRLNWTVLTQEVGQ